MLMSEHEKVGLDLVRLQMPLVSGSLEAIPLAVELLVPLHGTEGYDHARIAATSFLVGASMCLQFGPQASEFAGEVLGGLGFEGFRPDFALMGFESQRQLTTHAQSVH
jgi:hypothetical protein